MKSGWRGWAKEKKIASAYCKANGYELVESKADYQVAKIKTDGVCIVIYPHKTSAYNYHLRLRNEGSKDIDKAYRIMSELDAAAGFNSTFYFRGKYAQLSDTEEPTQ